MGNAWLVGAVLIAGLAAWWNYAVDQKKQELLALARPFFESCNSAAGCVTLPAGWAPTTTAYRLSESGKWSQSTDAASFRGGLDCVANSREFELRWLIATDVYLVARGRTGGELVVDRIVQ